MAVMIKDMEIPSCCAKCDFKEDYCFYCTKLHKSIPQSNFFDSRLPDCPLIEIGKCKECERWNGYKYCAWIGTQTEADFYCADFKKRGNENGNK